MSPRGKVEVSVHERGLRFKAKAFTLSIPSTALLRCIELDVGNRNGATCVLQLDPDAVGAEGAVPKGGKEYVSWARKPTDPDLRAQLGGAGIGPEWTTTTSFKAEGGKQYVPAYVKASEVVIVPLDTLLLVLGKPTVCVPYDAADITIPEAVNGRKTFDMAVSFAESAPEQGKDGKDGKGGKDSKGGKETSLELSMVPTSMHPALFDFLRRQKKAADKAGRLKKGAGAQPDQGTAAGAAASDEDGPGGQQASRDGEQDAGARRGGAGGQLQDEEEGDDSASDDDDSDEEEDEDFKPGDESDVEEEYDSDGGAPMIAGSPAGSHGGGPGSGSDSDSGADEPALKSMRTG
jgi:structure-specific recognition protein 1